MSDMDKYSRVKCITDEQGGYVLDSCKTPSPTPIVVETPVYTTQRVGVESPKSPPWLVGTNYPDTVDVLVRSTTSLKLTVEPPRTGVTRCLTSAIAPGTPFKRAGIVPTARIGSTNYFLFCIDAKYKQITDPGGHLNSGEDFLSGAARELKEETQDLFNLPIQVISNTSATIPLPFITTV